MVPTYNMNYNIFSDLLSVVNSLCSVNMLLKCESQTNSRGSHTSYPVANNKSIAIHPHLSKHLFVRTLTCPNTK